MKTTIAKEVVYLVVFCAALLLASCNFPSGTSAPLAQAQFTQAAETVQAQIASVVSPATVTALQGTAPAEGILVSPTATKLFTLTASPTPPPTQMPPPLSTPTEALKRLFADDFSTETGWYTEEGENYGFVFSDGGYKIYVNISYANIWSIRDVIYTDVILEVDAAQLVGPEDGYYGLLCRQVDGENYYALVIGSAGFYGIGKMENGEFEFLQEGQDTSGVIKTGANVVNKLRADCIGSSLRLLVNGQKLVEVQDDDYAEGVGGLLAGTRKQSGLQALFDNFAVFQQITQP